MSFSDFKDFYSRHKEIIHKYNQKQSHVETMLEQKDVTTDSVELSILETWIVAGSQWLRDNENEYNKAMTVSKLCEEDVHSVFTLYEQIYGAQEWVMTQES